LRGLYRTRNFEAVIEKAKLAYFNSGYPIDNHFADVSKMVKLGRVATPAKKKGK